MKLTACDLRDAQRAFTEKETKVHVEFNHASDTTTVLRRFVKPAINLLFFLD